MSRTWHHGDKAKHKKFEGKFERFMFSGGERNEWGHRVDEPKRKRYHEGWWPMRTTPSHWTRIMMTRPQRAKVRQLIHQTMKIHDLEDAPCFPLAKRPHVYYW